MLWWAGAGGGLEEASARARGQCTQAGRFACHDMPDNCSDATTGHRRGAGALATLVACSGTSAASYY